jgi:uncharacterized protein (DUF1778 family)
MMTTYARQSEKNISRIDLRLPPAAKKTIDQAAALRGSSRTDFVIVAALEKAERIIAEEVLIQLTIRDQQMLAQALTDMTSEPATPFLKALAAEYSQRVSGA